MEKFTSATLREVKGKKGKTWKGILRYRDGDRWRQTTKALHTFLDENDEERSVRNKTQASKALKQWREEMEREAGNKPEARMTMYEIVKSYVDRREKISEAAGWDTTARGPNNERIITRSTVRDYRHTLSYLKGNFPETEVYKLTPKDILEWEDGEIEAGHSISRIRKVHVLCKQALDDAVTRGYIQNSCMASLKALKLGRHDNNALTQADAKKLTAQLAAFDASASAVGAMLALHCGLRGGEICGLQWGDVDFGERHVTVGRSVGIADGGKFLKETKSESGNRTIWMDEYVLDVLKRRKAKTLAERNNITKGFDELFVVGNVDGDFLSPTTLSRQFTAISKALGLRGKTGAAPTLHKMRHTFVDALRGGNGGDNKATRDVMGHSSRDITDQYGTRDQDLMDDAVRRAAEWLRPEKDTKTEADVYQFDRTGTDS